MRLEKNRILTKTGRCTPTRENAVRTDERRDGNHDVKVYEISNCNRGIAGYDATAWHSNLMEIVQWSAK
jgi:hypothetical protein